MIVISLAPATAEKRYTKSYKMRGYFNKSSVFKEPITCSVMEHHVIEIHMLIQLNEASRQVLQKMKITVFQAKTRLIVNNKYVQITWVFLQTVVGLQHECQQQQLNVIRSSRFPLISITCNQLQ
jgi:hypothetical protein